VPTAVGNDMLLKLTRGKLDGVREALDLGSRISLVDPGALARMTGGSELADDVVLYSHYLNSIGLTPDEAAQRVIDRKDPVKVRQRAQMMDNDIFVKKPIELWANEFTISSLFDNSVFPFDTPVGEDVQQKMAIVSHYNEMLEESTFDADGLAPAGRALADDRFKRIYGITEFSPRGPKVVTYLPPEKTYPPDAAGSHTYIREQLNTFLAAEGIKYSAAFLTADQDTEHDVAAGVPRRYQVYYRDENGAVLHYPKQFSPKPPSREQVEAARTAALAGQGAGPVPFNGSNKNLKEERERSIDRMLAWPLKIPAPSSPGSAPAFPDAGPLHKTKRNEPLRKTKRKN